MHSENLDWFPPRVSACNLLYLVYKTVSAVDAEGYNISIPVDVDGAPRDARYLKTFVVELFEKCCTDGEPMVKRSAAKNIAKLANELDPRDTSNADLLVKQWLSLSNNNQSESVRCNAVACAPAIFALRSLTDEEPSGAACLFCSCVEAQSWKVRAETAKSLPAVARAIRNASRPTKEKELVKAKDLFNKMLKDSETEVKYATAKLSATFAAELRDAAEDWHDDGGFITEGLFPVLEEMVRDESNTSREELAGVLLQLVRFVRKDIIKKLFVDPPERDKDGRYLSTYERKNGLLEDLLFSQDSANERLPPTDFRLAVMRKLGLFCERFGVDKFELGLIVKLLDDNNWCAAAAA